MVLKDYFGKVSQVSTFLRYPILLLHYIVLITLVTSYFRDDIF